VLFKGFGSGINMLPSIKVVRVAFIVTNLATGGAEIMLLKLLQHLGRDRYEPTVISLMGLGEVGPRIAALGIPVHSMNMRLGVPNPLKVLMLVRLLRRLKPDLVQTWMYHADLLGGLAARMAGCRLIIWCLRQSNLAKAVNKRSTLWVVAACAMISSWLPRHVLSCSKQAKIVHAAKGYQQEKIHFIPNGFELDRFQSDVQARHSVRVELGLPVDTPLVGLMARYDPQKNHLGFMQAAALLHAQMPEVHFLLAGSGVDRQNESLQAAVVESGLLGHMHLLGRRDDVPRLMAALDVLASPSHGEAFPNVLGEAMACGVPCVVTNVGDSAEIVGDTGRVVPAGDMKGLARELREVLQLPPLERLALGSRARARVAAEYEISHVAMLYQAFYERVLAENNQRNA